MQAKTFDLTLLNGANGFNVPGVAAGGNLGYSVSTAGDINGDGVSDLVLGGALYSNGSGASYVIFGSRGGFMSSFNLTNLNGTNGFTVPGVAVNDGLGFSVSTAGDINGDGIGDLILGAPGTNAGFGASYVIFGSRGGFISPFNLNNLNGNNGFSIQGIATNGALGTSVSSAGDINGDGIADLVLGAPNANSNNGASYVLFGSRGGFPTSFNLANLNGTNGFAIPGVVPSELGYSVSGAGDVNGDNVTDLVLGAYGVNSANGTSYVIFGSRGGFSAVFNLSTLNGSNGFSVPGIASAGYLGASVSSAGDVNADGIADLVLGASGVNSLAGASYVIFGSRTGFTQSFDLTSLNGNNGFVAIPGTGYLGFSVSGAGDVNNDGIADLVLGAPGGPLTGNANGASYVVFGTRSGFPPSFNLTNLNGSNGFTVPGIVFGGQLGSSVASSGDINGDNITDLVLGARYARAYSVPVSYVLFGGSASITLAKNALTITQGQTIVLTGENLSIFGAVFPLSSLNLLAFTTRQVQGGHFTLVSNPTIAVVNFTQQQISNGQIAFISDRTAPVAYQIGVYNVTDSRLELPFVQAAVNFTNYPPVVLTSPYNQTFIHDRPFNFTFLANQTFNDTDGDPLTYLAESEDGSPLPNWIQFTSQNNQLTFSGAPLPLTLGTTQLNAILNFFNSLIFNR